MFSTRTNWPLAPNRLSQLLRERRERGLPILDLAESNPTRCGFSIDAEETLGPLHHFQALRYQPDPHGLEAAREAVARYYAGRGATLSLDQIFLTASTSEAYSYLFRLLANPGDAILAPQPSYPLFDFLGELNDVEVRPYPLVYDDGWRVDMETIEGLCDARARAVLVVHPNNPTGSYLQRSELGRMAEICVCHQTAIIADEVFADFGFREDAERVVTHASHTDALTFTLSGLSKICALPQMKLGWIVVTGPEPLRREAEARLEVIADTYLSVSAPVALAAPAWLEQRNAIQKQLRERTQANLLRLDALLKPARPITRLNVEGGWYAVLRVPATRTDEEWAAALLTEQGVSVHPGHFYDFPSKGYLVVSLLPAVEIFEAAAEKLVTLISAQS